MATLVRITMGSTAPSVVEAALVSAAPLSPPPHAPRRSTPPKASTTALRMTALSGSDVGVSVVARPGLFASVAEKTCRSPGSAA